MAHFREIALGDDRFAIEIGEHFKQRAQILVTGLDVKHPGAAIAEQRLDDDVLVFIAEGMNLGPVIGDQGRRHQAVEMGDEKLFRRITDMSRVVDHQGLWVDMLKHMRRGDIGHVEGRVLAHQHHIHVAREIIDRSLSQSEMIPLNPAHRQWSRLGGDPAVLER